MHLAVLLAGFTAILGQLIELNEGLLVWYRMGITSLSLLLLLWFQGKLQRVSLKQTAGMIGVGCIIAIHWVCFYGSVKYGNVSIAVVCISASGFFTSLFEPLINRTRIRLVEVLLGVLAIAGIYIIFDFHPQFKTGILFGIVSAMGSSLFPIFNKRILHQTSPEMLTMVEMFGGWLMLTLVVPIYLQYFPATGFWPGWGDWGWLLLLSWICTIYCFHLQLRALHWVSPFTINLAYNLEPVYGILLAFWIFKENLNLNMSFYLGVALILLAVLLQMYRIKSRSPLFGRVNFRGDRRK